MHGRVNGVIVGSVIFRRSAIFEKSENTKFENRNLRILRNAENSPLNLLNNCIELFKYLSLQPHTMTLLHTNEIER